MIAQEWTISGLSTELNRDRRTIAKAISNGNVQHVRADGKAKYYRMAEVVNALFNTGELDLEQERAQLAREQSRKLKRENDEQERKLIPLEKMVEVLGNVAQQMASGFDALPLNIKRRIPSLKSKEIGWIKKEIAQIRKAMANIKIEE